MGTNKKNIISLKEVSLVFKQDNKEFQALGDINLNVYNDDFICLLGPSGCGKTSLLNVLAGYVKPTNGEISVEGKALKAPNPEVGVIFQQPNLFPWLDVRKNVEFGLKQKKIKARERNDMVDYYLEVVGLSDFAGMLPYQLSGGMHQRAAIARTLATDPKIVLLDEPFSALDALTREKMQTHIYSIWEKAKKSFFFITHDVDEALLLSNRVLIMHPNPGTLVKDFKNPLNKDSKHFFREVRETKQFWDMRESLIHDIQTDKDEITVKAAG